MRDWQKQLEFLSDRRSRLTLKPIKTRINYVVSLLSCPGGRERRPLYSCRAAGDREITPSASSEFGLLSGFGLRVSDFTSIHLQSVKPRNRAVILFCFGN